MNENHISFYTQCGDCGVRVSNIVKHQDWHKRSGGQRREFPVDDHQASEDDWSASPEETTQQMDELRERLLADPRGAKHYWSTRGEVEAVHAILTNLRSHEFVPINHLLENDGGYDEGAKDGYAIAISLIESGKWQDHEKTWLTEG